MYVNVEVDISDFLNDISETEYAEIVREGVEQGYGPDGWHHEDECASALMENPIKLLGIITELRRQGYAVEPGGNNAHSS